MISALNLSSGAGTPIDLLVTAHRGGGAVDLIPTTAAWWNVSGFRDLAAVAAHGDPAYWPGLTDPAVVALSAHLQALADDCEEGESNAGKVFPAQIMTDALQAHESSLEQYERLAPVLKGLASLLHHLRSHNTGGSAAQAMAEMLRSAPTQALAGPLQPLVQAFGQRVQSGMASSGEEWWTIIATTASRFFSNQREEALRPLTDALERVRSL